MDGVSSVLLCVFRFFSAPLRENSLHALWFTQRRREKPEDAKEIHPTARTLPNKTAQETNRRVKE